MKNEKYIIGYARKSTDEKDKQIRSIDDQKIDINNVYSSLTSDEKKYPLLLLEESASAYKPDNRPVFNKIISMALKGEVEKFIVYNPTRISRNPQDTGIFMQLLTDGTIPEVITSNGNRYNKKDTSQIFMLMLESNNSWKRSADDGISVSAALTKKAGRGEVIARAPLGYINKGSKGETYVEFDKMRKPIIEKIFAYAETGVYSLEELKDMANKDGLMTREYRDRENDCIVPEKPLTKNSISNMLKNPFYKGYIRFKGEVYKGKHQPMIEPVVWEKIQLNLHERYRGAPRSQNDVLADLFIMSGVVRCGDCGRKISFYQSKGKYVYGECKNRQTKCKQIIRQSELLKQLNIELESIELQDGAEEFIRKNMQETHEREMKNEKSKREVYESQYSALTDEIGEYIGERKQAERDGVLDAFEAKLSKLKERRETVQTAIANLHDDSNKWIDCVLESFGLIKLAQEAIAHGSPHVRQAILKAIGSEYVLRDKKLVWEPKSPFKQVTESDDCIVWGEIRDSNPRPSGPQPGALTN